MIVDRKINIIIVQINIIFSNPVQINTLANFVQWCSIEGVELK